MRIRSHYRKVKRGRVVVRSHVRKHNLLYKWTEADLKRLRELQRYHKSKQYLESEKLRRKINDQGRRLARKEHDARIMSKAQAYIPTDEEIKELLANSNTYLTQLKSLPKKTRLDQKNRKHSYIFLGKPTKLGVPSQAYTYGKEHIYIEKMPFTDVDQVADTIAHEELHRVLRKNLGKKAFEQLDNIQTMKGRFDIPAASWERAMTDTTNIRKKVESNLRQYRALSPQEIYDNAKVYAKVNDSLGKLVRIRPKHASYPEGSTTDLISPKLEKEIVQHVKKEISQYVKRRK